MTTIACDGRKMAGDGQREMRGTITNRNALKVRRMSDGSLLGTAGDTACGYALVEWLEKGGEPPKLDPESGFSAIQLTPAGDALLYDKHCIPSPIDLPFAIGSGMDIAIGALAAGADPEEAVRIAASYDPGTGGSITVLSINAKPHLEAA